MLSGCLPVRLADADSKVPLAPACATVAQARDARRGLLLFRQRQPHREGRTRALAGFRGNRPAVRLDDLACRRQPDPTAGNTPDVAPTPETFEDMREVSGRNTHAPVTHGQHSPGL